MTGVTSVTSFLASIGLPEVVAGIMVLALNAYVLMGGADYGGGLWDLLAAGPRREEQRTLIASSIGPIWEANHVWLIVVVVLLFTAFPMAFGTITTVLHIPLALLLIGIIMRGSAFVFRSYGSPQLRTRRRWGLAFAIASTAAPLLLGVVIGAIGSGAVGTASGEIGAASFGAVFVHPWLAPFPIAVGCFALVLFAFLAAVYLTVDATNESLRDDFRRRALGAAVTVFVLAAVVLVRARADAPLLAHGLIAAPWAIALHGATAIAAIAAFVCLWTRRYRAARIAAAAQVSCILWGWVLAQYPFVVPMTLTIRQTSAPDVTLVLLLIGLAAGAAILVPALLYLFRVRTGVGES